MEVLDGDTSSLQAMASAPLLERAVCASCSEEIVDKYLLKVNTARWFLCKFFFSCFFFARTVSLNFALLIFLKKNLVWIYEFLTPHAGIQQAYTFQFVRFF